MNFEQQLQSFMAAIRQRESTNDYMAYNDKTHPEYGNARGAYQIMSKKIWPAWVREIGLDPNQVDWRDPAVQDMVARHKMTQYYRQFGDWRLVAAAWHGGTGAAKSIRAGKGWGSDMDGTPTVNYMNEVVAMMGDVPINQPASGAAQSGFDNVVAPQQSNSEVGNPMVDGIPLDELEESRDKIRVTYQQALETMSQTISGNPNRFATLYGQIAPITDERDPEMEVQ